jgi:ribulokinase
MAERHYVIGVDVGTTGAKAVLTTDRGEIVAEHATEYEVLTPRPVWAEQWPDVWLEGMVGAVRGVLGRAAVDARQVRAMTVSSLYGGSGIPVDADMKPLRPCLIWMDRRAQAETAWVKREIPQDELLRVTGNGVDSYYGFTKILWIQRHEPETWKRIRYLLPPNAYLIYRLTGEVAVDHSSAGNIGGVYDIGARTWSASMCSALGIPMEMLPERLVASADVVGTLHGAGAAMTGLPEGLPICAGGVDAAVATLSASVFEPGQHVAMMGTSMCWGFIHRQAPREAGLVSMPYVLDPATTTYTFGGAATAGGAIKWFRDQLGGVEQAVERWTRGGANLDAYAQLDARAATVPPGSDGLLVLPYLMGERSPIWDVHARGTILGLTLFHTRGHLYRAFLEGVAYALRHNMDAGRAAGYPLNPELLLVGGTAKSRLWTQVIADVTGYPVLAADSGGEAALGDAMLAALGVGLADEDAIAGWVEAAALYRRFEPDPAAAATYARTFPHYVGLYEDLRERFALLAADAEANAAS